ncbi:unnamed protein product [Gongylonema pulchrum]|uniref:RICTOR_V domain-containing protein n=1 Tax=Gongylonema pulchrum TaxID=637853 RepID=A0A183EPA2_9BILA|nr:unnamed protein product [Gongylonema pulchrum]
MPVHLYGQLAQHETGRDILLKTGEADRLLDLLRDSPVPLDVHETSEIKSALYALGHIAAVVDPSLLPLEVLPVICRFAECCPVLSIRGTAYWVLSLVGGTEHG